MGDDFYSENTETCQSSLSKYRVKPYHWKGMNKDQQNDVLLEQERMVGDRHQMNMQDKEADSLWAQQQEKIRRDTVIMQMQHKQRRDDTLQSVIEYNKLKALEDKKRNKPLYDGLHSFK